MMYNLTVFQKSYFLTNFKASEKWPYVRKSCPRVGRWQKAVFESLETIFSEHFKKSICTPCQGFAFGNRTKNELVVLYFQKERSILLSCKTDVMGKPRKTSCKIYKGFAQQ